MTAAVSAASLRRNTIGLSLACSPSLIAQGMASDAAIIAAAEHRARPICLTACAAILGMIPISHQVFWGPMAYAIIGGLLIATLVTLTVLPASLSLLLHLRMTSSGETCEK